jgi:predicted phosphodiesterase
MSDVHGNLPALMAVQRVLPEYDTAIVAGDLCLEGPCPSEVLDLLDEYNWSLVLGNTDRDVAFPSSEEDANKAQLIAWTRERLGHDRIERLASLPRHVRIESDSIAALVVHANPLNLDDQLYPTMSEEALRPYLETVDAEILCFGHLHIPYVRPVLGVLLADVSSVGHPKDHDLRAAFTILTFDGGMRSVEQVRVPYDIDATVNFIRQSDMPNAEQAIESLLKAAY